MSKSIRYYYFTSIAAVMVASVLVMGIIQTYLASTYFREEKENLLEQVVAVVTSAARADMLHINEPSNRTLDYVAGIAGAGVLITDADGNILLSSSEAAVDMGAKIPARVLADVATAGTYRELGRLNGFYSTNHYIIAAPIISAEGTIEGFVFASSNASGLRVYLSDMMSSFILSAGLMMMVASLLAIILTNRTVIPIRRVSAAARQFAEGNYAARVPVEGDDELAQLAITFNEMANSFEATDVSRRSFMGNIAHELRTPMTTIKGFIDGMLDGTIPEDQRDKYLKIVSQEVGRLARLTKNMLDISKLEAGEYVPTTTTFDIRQVITSVFLGAVQRLEEKNINVEGLNSDTPILVMADEDFVYQIIFNIVDNAIKFTNEGGKIDVTVKQIKAVVTVEIRNSGSGIEPDVLPHVFDRFYKADPSRGVNAGGSGLGLHICKVLIGLMGGRFWAKSEPGQWAEFSFTLPAGPNKKITPRRSEG